MGFELEGFSEERGGVDVGVAVDLAVTQEGCVFEAGDEFTYVNVKVKRQ